MCFQTEQMNLVEKVHRQQRTRHFVANKITPALTVLRDLQDGKPVSPKLLKAAIVDLQALMEWVDKRNGQTRSPRD